ncbi:uncharacterized protein LOC127243384 [Andrographis paniculata]|uniref:uncharacterized protein LOC127243384 n=1 Tax=Andrographis paniculata TaxID=175694 RepID=UPI0021E7741F|nr:uncharacterized protein LOC127243384 [Andrographis paniculata]
MENGDDWFAIDKLYHVLFCFFVSIVFSAVSSRSRRPFIRRRSSWLGSVASLAAGAAKEFADEFGYFKSAGASAKDAVADLVGILLAAAMLYLFNRRASFSSPARSDGAGRTQAVELV